MSLNIEISFDDKSNIWDVKLSGEVDLYSANELKEELNIAIEEHKEDLKIDLQKSWLYWLYWIGNFDRCVKEIKTGTKGYIYSKFKTKCKKNIHNNRTR